MLTIALVVPMVLQLEHVVSKPHENSNCVSPNDLHIDVHERSCLLFHQQIDHSSITFTAEEPAIKIPVIQEITIKNDTFFDKGPKRSASSRAPPFSLA